ncbi:transposase [Streptomyces sp. TSRI0281]|uniref:transposase n=1 Tax=Streptomyces sp. TSRI0281 TaxID=1718998 RepID=UPI003FD6A565
MKAALLGRSRGGQTSKVHLAADRKCRPLAIVLTAGQPPTAPSSSPCSRRSGSVARSGRPRTRPDAVAGDKAYSSRGNRAYLRKRQIKAVIPEKKDQAANRKRKGSPGRPARQPRHRPLQREEHRRTPDQETESLAGHRHPLRQDTRKLPRRPPSPCLHDLDQGPHTNQLITTQYAP